MACLGVGDDREQKTNAIFSGLISAGEPGAAVLVVNDGHIAFERGYGVTDLRTQHAIDRETNFRLASVTKQFTAMAIMLLAHDGKLQYEERLTDVFPEFPTYGKNITIRNLLNHTSGLPDYEDLMAPQPPNLPDDQIKQITDQEVLALLEKQTAGKFAPGSRWSYCNSGYVVLGLIVQKVSGVPFPQFLHDRIFAPLRMDSSVAYVKGTNTVTQRAFGHSKIDGRWRQTDQSPTSATLGDGRIYSSLQDLAKWDAALSNHTLLSQSEMQPALTPVKVPISQPVGPEGETAEYGFGWFLNPYKGHAHMWHYGETMGFRTAIHRFMDAKLTVIVLCNRSDLNPDNLALRVADLYLGK